MTPIPPAASRLLAAGAVAAGLGVAAGAFGAHALRDTLSPERLATWGTGADYALAHGLAAVLAGALAAFGMPRATLAGWLFVAGIVLFSGSLWMLVLLDVPVLGAVTPLGGLAFLAGWSVLAASALRAARNGPGPRA